MAEEVKIYFNFFIVNSAHGSLAPLAITRLRFKPPAL
jgi:hypothetical protein